MQPSFDAADGYQQWKDRREAGQALGAQLRHYTGQADVIVLAIPRGGVPVGYEVAMALGAPLDVFLVRKLGLPGHEELAIGAIASGGVRILNSDIIAALHVPDQVLETVFEKELVELERRETLYRHDRPPLDLAGRTVILVDDGLATGASMLAAVTALRRLHIARIVVAVPVASFEACASLETEADEIVCPITPENFYAVGAWYEDFSQTTDEEVRRLIDQAAAAAPPAHTSHPA